MYIQITTRCNMNCAHCCSSCTEEGEDMTFETFLNALNFGDEYNTIGGGEPTLHPQFIEMLFEAIGKREYVWLATNGSQTKISLTLAKLAKKGVIGCALSQDIYHDKIDNEVIEAFTKPKNSLYSSENNEKDQREIRNVTDKEIIAGRNTDTGKEGCVCPDLMIKPDGTIKSCGCETALTFGNINTEYKIPDNWQYGECYKNQEQEE